jgi:hypothetical protein
MDLLKRWLSDTGLEVANFEKARPSQGMTGRRFLALGQMSDATAPSPPARGRRAGVLLCNMLASAPPAERRCRGHARRTLRMASCSASSSSTTACSRTLSSSCRSAALMPCSTTSRGCRWVAAPCSGGRGLCQWRRMRRMRRSRKPFSPHVQAARTLHAPGVCLLAGARSRTATWGARTAGHGHALTRTALHGDCPRHARSPRSCAWACTLTRAPQTRSCGRRRAWHYSCCTT